MAFNFDKLNKDTGYDQTADIRNMIKTAQTSKPIVKTPTVVKKKSNLGSDLLNTWENLGSGIIQGGLGITNYLTSVAKPYAKALGIKGVDEFQSNISSTMQNKAKQIQSSTDSIDNSILKKASQYIPTIGQMIPTIGASLVNPILGTGTAITSAGGQYIEDAKSKGANDAQALLYGTGLGVAEGATEMLGIGALTKGAKQVAKGGIKAGLKSLGTSVANNAIQEAAMEPITEATSQVVLGKSNWKDVPQRMLQSGIDGATVSLIMAGAGSGFAKSINIANKIENGKQVTDLELQQAKAEVQAKPLNTTVKLPVTTPQVNTSTLTNQVTSNVPTNQNVLKPVIPQTEKVAKLLSERPSIEKPSISKKIEKGIGQELINKGYYIDKLSKETGNQELKFKYDKMLGSQGEGQNSIGTAQTNNKGEVIGKSLNDIWKPVEKSGKVQEFSDYLLQKHNIDRMAQGKPIFGENVTAQDSALRVSEYEKNNPEFIYWSKDINTYNQNNLQNMVDAGLTSEETQKLLNDTYQNYVRIQRDSSKTKGPIGLTQTGVKVNNPIQKAKGGNQDIKPLKDSMAEQVLQIKNAIRRNDFGLELLKTTGGTKSNTVDVDNIVSEKTNDKPNTFTVFQNGQPVTIELNDELFSAIKPSSKNEIEILKPARAIAKVQRSLITDKNPFFIARNFLKDFQDGIFNSKYLDKFVQNYAKGLKEIKTNGKLWQQYQGLGGNSNTFFEYDTGLKKEAKGIGKVGEWISKANSIVEQAPRFAEFISTIEAGKSTSEAMYNAAEVTTNFKRGGDISKAINKNGGVFFNASVQGFDKFVRNFSEQPGAKPYIKLLSKAVMLGIVPALLNDMFLSDDEDYQKLNDRDKDAFYLFPTGDGKFIKIPKGRALSVFGASARAVLEGLKGNKEALKNLPNFIGNQIAPINPIESNIISPLLAVANNKSWSGGQIVPQRLESLPAGMQSDENTSSLASAIGSATNISPKNIDYLIKQYGGVIGQAGLPLFTPKAEQNPLASNFTLDSVNSNKIGNTFYDKLDQLTKEKNAESLMKMLPSGTATTKSLQSSYLNKQSSKVSDLYTEKRKIELSGLSDDEKRKQTRELQKQINTIEENALKNIDDKDRINYFSKVADIENNKSLDGVEGAKTQAKAKLILNSKFDKTEQVELFDDFLTKDQKEKVDKVVLNTKISKLQAQEFYTTISNIQGDKRVNEKGKSETIDGSTMSKKVQALKKLSINDTQKNQLLQELQPNTETTVKYDDIKNLSETSYQTYFALTSKQREDYQSFKKLNINENILNKYYAEIGKVEGQKDANGNTISGSKKQAVVKYINSLKGLSPIEKTILYANSGYTINKQEIFNYIDKTKGLSKADKQAIWNSLGY